MSIAFDAGFMHGGAFGLMFDESSSPAANPVTSSSSLGKNSDDDEEENDEAESLYKGALDMREALEDVLPIRRGISKFYNYKSKSFTSLAEAASSSSVKEIAKPDDPYTKKRRNILASTLIWDKSRNSSLRSICGGGISKSSSKRTITSSQSTLALAAAMRSAETSPSSSGDSSSSSLASSSFNKLENHASSWRSLSLSDLQQCATSAAVNTLQMQTCNNDSNQHNDPSIA